MSSLSVRTRESADSPELARLIPGEVAAIRNGMRKPPSAATKDRPENLLDLSEVAVLTTPKNNLAFLLPPPMQQRNGWRWLRAVSADLFLIMGVWLLLGGLLVLLSVVSPRTRVLPPASGAPSFLLGVAVLHAVLVTLVGYSGGLYGSGSGLTQQGRTLANSVFWSTTVLATAFALQGDPRERAVLVFTAGALSLLVLFAWRRACRHQGRSEPLSEDLHNVLIIGAGAAGRQVASCIRGSSQAARHVCGFLDDERPIGDGVIGRICDLASVARSAFIDEVILATPLDRGLGRQLLREARQLRLDVEIVPELLGCQPADAVVEHVGDLPLISLHAERLPAAGLACKRVMDVLGAGSILCVLAPLFLVIAIVIKFESPGPILYRAQRAGRKGMPFPCLKFRTMVRDADEQKEVLRGKNQRSGPFFKIANDPRITRMGQILRRYSLDELPQLWNVVRGEMSLVGPRPHPLDDFAGYRTEHLARLDMTPGITGLWQVTARRDPSFQRGMELDREYIRSWNLGLDLRILFKTMLAVLQGGGE